MGERSAEKTRVIRRPGGGTGAFANWPGDHPEPSVPAPVPARAPEPGHHRTTHLRKLPEPAAGVPGSRPRPQVRVRGDGEFRILEADRKPRFGEAFLRGFLPVTLITAMVVSGGLDYHPLIGLAAGVLPGIGVGTISLLLTWIGENRGSEGFRLVYTFSGSATLIAALLLSLYVFGSLPHPEMKIGVDQVSGGNARGHRE